MITAAVQGTFTHADAKLWPNGNSDTSDREWDVEESDSKSKVIARPFQKLWSRG